ncbi:MAG: rhomboid family intramembrane serine protease [Candidatus Pacearchaeota archaeon]|jgi:membrane associated rhomboid family serine protease
MDKRLRTYTKKNLKNNFLENFFRKLSMTNWIIAFNVIIFVLILILISIFGEEKIISVIALQANSFFNGNYWTLLTSMFSHIYFWHLLANMFSLFFIGNFVEKLIGRKRFFWLYLISGLFAGLVYVLLSYYFGASVIGAKIFGSPDIFALGASGAVFSLLGLLAVLTPYSKVYLIAGPLIAIIVQSVVDSLYPTASFIGIFDTLIFIYIMVAIFTMFSFNPKWVKIALPLKMSFWILPIIAILPLVLIGLVIPLPIGNTAHFGGLVAGLIYAYYLKKRYKKKTELIKRYFSS